MKLAVILLSGGLDSTTAAAWAAAQGFKCHGLTVDYGQRHHAELACAAKQAELLNLAGYRLLESPLGRIGGSALTDRSLEVPSGPPGEGIPVTYVPARNLNMLTLAAAVAEVMGGSDLVIGANVVDYSGYPDCRRPFFDALETTLMAGTKLGAEGRQWQIHTPLIDLEKTAIVRMGLDFGVDYAETSSCYNPAESGAPCCECESCHIRSKAFAAIQMEDPRQQKYCTGARR